MQAPSQPNEDRSGGFDRGGWAAPYWDETMALVQEEAMAEPYDLLLGRKTYELFAPHWAEGNDSPIAEMFNNATKYVATTTLHDLMWKNSVVLDGDVASKIVDLKQQDGPLLQVHGSWRFIQTLLAHDLIDEFRLWTFPVIVGSGKRLFEDAEKLKTLKLIKTRSTENGVVMNIYRRKAKTG